MTHPSPSETRRLVRDLADRIAAGARGRDGYAFMEVCGTHTQAIGRWALRDLLPDHLRLVSGPGCPVCVTPGGYIDNACRLALDHGAVIATFGDLVRVPGDATSLEEARGAGAEVRVVYSPLDALGVAKEVAPRPVVFLAIGFETTIAAIAAAIHTAAKTGPNNLGFYLSLRTVPPALRALLEDPALRLDGFLLPGHVSSIIGRKAYGFLEARGMPGMIAGFEPVDILLAVAELVDAVNGGAPAVRNLYPRAVREEGNAKALALIDTLFHPADAVWRGLGTIPASGLALREPYAGLDAARRFDLPAVSDRLRPGCRCGDVLRGAILPPDCPLFGEACTPVRPVGPCMVSSEGSCSAHYAYGRPASPRDHDTRKS